MVVNETNGNEGGDDLAFLLCKSDHDFQRRSCFFLQHARNCDGSKKTMIPRVLTLVPRAPEHLTSDDEIL